MPILKQLVSSSSQAKRRSRTDLTAEMISAPLGDFRHTMHVGRGGDAFGDTSFLSSRCVEPPRDPQTEQSGSAKQGLLARTFRSSKRSHSSSRSDNPESATPPAGSPAYVKNAISLPYLNEEEASRARGAALHFPKSVSSTPAKKLPEANPQPANGPTTAAVRDLELVERDFGELTDLPVSSAPPRGGMKHAESILSFHIDLGPSMLGDILSVMDRKGYEEEPCSPMPCPLSESAQEVEPPVRPPRLSHTPTSPYTPELHSQKPQQHPERCGVSSSGSKQERPHKLLYDRATDGTKHTPPRAGDDSDLSFMDDDDDEDEIRV